MNTLSSILFGSVAAVSALVAPLSDAQTEIQSIPQEYVTTSEANVLLRCAPGSAYYAVAELQSGTVLIADGETESGWLRVRYPENTPAYVPESAASRSGDSLTLTRDDNLRALHMTSGHTASWNKLLAQPLPSGRKLKLKQAVSIQDNTVGYIVEAPDEARGFIRRNQTNAATQAEIDQFNGIAQEEPEQAPEPAEEPAQDDQPDAGGPAGATGTPAGGAIDATPGTDPVQTDPANEDPAEEPAGTPADQEPEAADGPADSNTGDQPAAEPANDPAEETPVESEDDRGPIRIIPRPENREPAPFPVAPSSGTQQTDNNPNSTQSEPEDLGPVASIDELERAFERVQRQSTIEAELNELIREIERTMGDEGTDPDVREKLAQRAEILRLRVLLQDELQKVAESERKADQRIARFNERVDALRAERDYTIVGRLATSGVYDGRDLPLMYRILDGSSANGPTIAYLKPQNDGEGRYIGRLVGIIGESRVDPRMGIRVISAESIEPISGMPGN